MYQGGVGEYQQEITSNETDDDKFGKLMFIYPNNVQRAISHLKLSDVSISTPPRDWMPKNHLRAQAVKDCVSTMRIQTVEAYVERRVKVLESSFREDCKRLSCFNHFLNAVLFISISLSALLGVLDLAGYIPVLAGVSGLIFYVTQALGERIDFKRKASADLDKILSWWSSLSIFEQSQSRNKRILVETCEYTVRGECQHSIPRISQGTFGQMVIKRETKPVLPNQNKLLVILYKGEPRRSTCC
jgi:hypothetical protein